MKPKSTQSLVICTVKDLTNIITTTKFLSEHTYNNNKKKYLKEICKFMNLSDWRGEDWRGSKDSFNKDDIIGVERDHGLALEYDRGFK